MHLLFGVVVSDANHRLSDLQNALRQVAPRRHREDRWLPQVPAAAARVEARHTDCGELETAARTDRCMLLGARNIEQSVNRTIK